MNYPINQTNGGSLPWSTTQRKFKGTGSAGQRGDGEGGGVGGQGGQGGGGHPVDQEPRLPTHHMLIAVLDIFCWLVTETVGIKFCARYVNYLSPVGSIFSWSES